MNGNLNPANPIMVVDDEPRILAAIDTTLRLAGLNNIMTFEDGRQFVGHLAGQQPELVLLDLMMPSIRGEELLTMITGEFPEIPVIIVTGSMDVESAVRCMKSGAFDYILKPVEEGRLLSAVTRGLEFRELRRENLALRQHILSITLDNPESFAEIVTNDRKMLAIFKYVESVAQSGQPVLITGETGTGKELVARAIHRASGRKGKFVAVNVAGLDDAVFTDTFFGHVKGAFTGADTTRCGLVKLASGGTLMLDEIGSLNQTSQLKLLRFLQEGEYLSLGLDTAVQANVRIVAATNEDLPELVKQGRLRKDFCCRLLTHHIHLPPLRERRDDIPILLNHFLAAASRELNKRKPTQPRELTTLLATYPFPGNIRELQAMAFDAVSNHESGTLSPEVFKAHMAAQGAFPAPTDLSSTKEENVIFPDNLPTLKQVTELLVAEAVKRANGVQSVAAGMLGISQQALSKRLKQEKPDRSVRLQ